MIDFNYGIIFPGQGSQKVSMLADIANQFNEVKQTFDEASTVLGYDLWELTQFGPAEQLNKTVHTQPALLAASFSIWRILEKNISILPSMLAGHSLGEYAALVCAQAMRFSDGIKLVAARGQFMQEAVAEGVGAMAAIVGLNEISIEDLCSQAKTAEEDILAPANFNSLGQVVIAGHRKPVEYAIALAKKYHAKLAQLIPVSVPSHCALMQPAGLRLEKLLNNISFYPPIVPIINNVDVKAYTHPEQIKLGLVRQLSMPVRWVEIIQFCTKVNINLLIECGPGKVLTGLTKRIDKKISTFNTGDINGLEEVLQYCTRK